MMIEVDRCNRFVELDATVAAIVASTISLLQGLQQQLC